MKTIPIPEDLFMAIGNYLASRPYREVAGMIQALEALKGARENTEGSEKAE